MNQPPPKEKTEAVKGLRIVTKINGLTGLCLAVALTFTLVLLWRTQVNVERDQKALTSYMRQMDLARVQQVNFKKQVQEWKDILLRGRNADDFQKYRGLFFEQESLVQKNAKELIGSLDQTSARAKLAEFLRAHEELGRRYRNALAVFEQSGRLDYQAADRMIRGMDRAPTDLIDAIVGSIENDTGRYKIHHASELRNEQRGMLMTALTVFMALMLASTLIARHISRPIHTLAQTMSKVSTGKDYSLRAVRISRDELALLTDVFNEMLAQVQLKNAALQRSHDDLVERAAEREQHQRQLLEYSRQAGMAEMATGVLHNVGNVLNSVNISSSCVAASLKNSKVGSLSKVVALLREHETDLGVFLTTDPKGRQVTPYLAQFAEHLVAEQDNALKELAELQKNVQHIKKVLTSQQNCAKGGGQAETLQMSDLLEDTLRMDSDSQAGRDVQVIKEFNHVPVITVDKHKVLQILMNLVRNAKQACQEAGGPEKRLTLRVSNGDDRVRVAVSDNGVGISPDNLRRIFTHGFTTKKDGHGFGLHSALAAAKEMGGSLVVQSDGVSRGATFTLELPVDA